MVNSVHRIRKAWKYNHCRLLRHDLLFVPHSGIVMGRIIEGILDEVRSDISKTMPLFLVLLVSSNYLNFTFIQARIDRFKLHSSYSKGTIW